MGTTNLKSAHRCSSSMDQFVKKLDIKLTPDEMKELLDLQTFHICSGLLAFRQTEDPGLKSLCKYFVSLGAKYGAFNPAGVMHERQAISENVKNLSDQLTVEYKKVVAVLEDKSLCIITDGWSDSVNKNSFLDYSISFIDNDFAMHNIQYSMKHFTEQKTAENIENSIRTICEELSLDAKKTSIITDSAANCVKACKAMVHFRCVCHRINTAVEKGYTQTLSQNQFLMHMDKSINSVIGYVNKANLQHELPIKLKSGCLTRPWRRYSDRFESLFKSYDKLTEVLKKVNILNLHFNFYHFPCSK